MVHLDFRTLFLTASIANLLICVGLATYWKTQKTYRGFGLWVADTVVLIPVFMLYGLRGVIPDFWSMVVANALVVLAAVLRLEGIKRFLGADRGRYLGFLLPVVVFILQVWFTFQRNDVLLRNLVVSAALAYCVFSSAWLLITHAQRRTRLLYGAVAGLFLIAGLILSVRTVLWFQAPELASLLSPTPINEVYYLYSLLLEIGLAMSFLMLNSQRLTFDLTDAQRTVEENNRRLTDIIDFLPDATLAIDKEGRVVAWNKAMEAMTGVPAAAMVGKGDYEYAVPFYGERRPLTANLAMTTYPGPPADYPLLQQDGPGLTAEITLALPNGTITDLWAKAAPLFDLEGGCNGAIESIRDITELRRQEQKIRTLNATLELQVQERTAQLGAAVEDLQRAARMKDEFMAAVSHELRTPLMGVLSMTEVLQLGTGGQLNERQTHYVQIIRQSGERLLAMISSILRFTKLTGNTVTLQQESCRLSELCAIGVHAVHERAHHKRQTILWTVRPAEVMIISDPDGIVQMLQQLLDNAVKFTPEGGHIGLEVSGDAGGDCVDLVVWDTGIGVTSAQQAAIFLPFVQGDGSLTRHFEGVGLGLAYVRRMVELLGGTITLTSTPGVGSRFTVTLPRKPARAPLPATAP